MFFFLFSFCSNHTSFHDAKGFDEDGEDEEYVQQDYGQQPGSSRYVDQKLILNRRLSIQQQRRN